jgi:hypothetical protein
MLLKGVMPCCAVLLSLVLLSLALSKQCKMIVTNACRLVQGNTGAGAAQAGASFLDSIIDAWFISVVLSPAVCHLVFIDDITTSHPDSAAWYCDVGRCSFGLPHQQLVRSLHVDATGYLVQSV